MSSRIALYIGNELYPGGGSDPSGTTTTLQQSPLTSPILSLLNQNGSNANQLVYNDGVNPVFDTSGSYIGSSQWPGIVQKLRGGNIKEVYLSFSTTGTTWMANLIKNNAANAQKILTYIKNNLFFDGVDLDYEGGDYSANSPIYPVAAAAIKAGLKLTAAPFNSQSAWQAWVKYVQGNQGTVAWLNLQCYAGGKFNSPGDWLSTGAPIVAGSCNNCGGPQTTCSPTDMQNLFTLWTTGKGSVSQNCWGGTPNTKPLAIGGGFIWVYSSIKGTQFSAYMNAVKTGLGM